MTEGPSRREIERVREALDRHDTELSEPNQDDAEETDDASGEQEEEG
jgi:hypothetical protein